MRSPISLAFVGRGVERAELADALAGRSRRVVIIEGEAGIGKTRLIAEALGGPGVDRSAVLVARCPPVRVPFTLGALVDAVARRSLDGVTLGPLAGVLRPFFPEWGDRLPLPPAAVEDRGVERHRLFRALCDLLVSLGVTAVVVDDLHWADEATFEFLLHLAVLDEPAIAVVASWRLEDMADRDLAAKLTRLAAGAPGRRLRLAPLDVGATGELAAAILGLPDLPRSLAVHLHERTGGVPLLVEELLRSLSEEMGTAGFKGEWTAARIRALPPPPSVRDSVLARMSQMSATAQDVVRALAVLAEAAEEPLVARVAGVDRDTARAALTEASETSLVTVGSDRRVWFRHGLLMDAVDEQIPPLLRPVLHERAAAALAARTPIPVARLARHLKEAGDLDGWARYAEQVADLALASGDDVGAKAVFFDLITGTRQSPQTLTRLVAKFPLPALAREDDYRRLARVLRDAADLGGLTPLEEGQLRWQLARVLINADDIAGACAQVERAVPLLAAMPALAGQAMITLIHLSWSDWPEDIRQARLRQAADLVRHGDATAGLILAVDLATVLLRFGAEQGWREAEKLPMREIEVPHRLLVARGLANVGSCALVWGRYDDAATYLATATELALEYEYPRLLSGLAVIQGHLDYVRGRWTGLAERLRAQSVSEMASAGVRLEADVVLGRLEFAAGRLSPAEALLRSALADATDHHGPELVMEAAACVAEIALAEARVQDALDVSELPFELLRRTGVWMWGAELVPARVRALLAADRLAEAREAVTGLARGLRDNRAPAARTGLLVARALLAEADGDAAGAATSFGQAADAWGHMGYPHAAIAAHEDAARCEARTDARRGGELLHAVLRAYSRMGAVGDASRVAAHLRELGDHVRPVGRRGGRTGYGEDLSPREREVVELVVAGRTDTEIAALLHKSLNTVRSQVKTAKRKLGAASRAELATAIGQGTAVRAAGSGKPADPWGSDPATGAPR